MVPYTYCQHCGAHRDAVGRISRRGKCYRCGVELLTENVVGIHTRTGPAYERWRSGMIRWALGLPRVGS